MTLSSITDAWPVLAGITSGPAILFTLYKWVAKQLLAQVALATSQRDASDVRCKTLQDEMDALQDRFDAEKDLRRTAEDKVFPLARITAERDELAATVAHLKGATS